MKKTLLIILILSTLSFYSCREDTEQKTQDAVEAFGRDIEENTKKAGRKIEEGANKVRTEVREGFNKIDSSARNN